MAEDFTNYETSVLSFDIIPTLNPYNEEGLPVLKINIEKFFESLDNIRAYITENGHQLTEKSVIIIVSHRKTIKEITGLSVANLGLVLQENVYNNEILFEGFP